MVHRAPRPVTTRQGPGRRTEPAAAQININVKDSGGKVIQSKQGWPAGTTSIALDAAAKFDFGKRFRYQSDMAAYTVSVISVRAWHCVAPR